jgi:hypothetical protein
MKEVSKNYIGCVDGVGWGEGETTKAALNCDRSPSSLRFL